MWCVHSAERVVEEDWPIGTDRLRVMNELDCLVRHVLGEVIALLGAARGLDVMVVVGQLWREMIGLALQEPIEPVEATLKRPVVEGSRGRGVRHLAEMPLADAERRVPLVAQHLGYRRRLRRNFPCHVRESGVEVGHSAHSDTVVIAAGQ